MNAIRHATVPGPSTARAEPSTDDRPAGAGQDPRAPVHGDARPRHVHHRRDFGIGYGDSSGYGRAQHFIDGHVDPPFRFR